MDTPQETPNATTGDDGNTSKEKDENVAETETQASTTEESSAAAAESDEPQPEEDVQEEPTTGISVEDIDDFGQVLAEYESGLKSFKEGEVAQGTILKVLEKEVIVDIGYKSEGVIDINEFRGPDGKIHIEAGTKVDVLLEKSEDGDGYVVLSKEKAERLKIWDVVEKAYETGDPVVGRVVDRIKGGLKVDIGLPAFLPGSLVDSRPVRNLELMIGQEFRMKVIKVNKRRGNIVLSRKAILDVENAEKKKKTLDDLEEGKILRGVVKNLTEYGAFIDLGGIDGLLHITDISWGRISHPSEKFQIGDELDVVVLKFDREKERVSLGFKQLQDDPWEFAANKYPPQSRIRGKVVSLTDYGAFVEVEEGIEGLIHVSEMSWTKRVKHPSKLLNVGDWVECVILDIDREARRLSLGLKQTEPNPWDLISAKYRVGDKLKGTVRNITDFGAFIEVEEGVDGLVHISDLSWNKRIAHPSEVLTKAEEIEAVILKIDSENQRLSLGIKQLEPNAIEGFFDSHSVGHVLRGKITRLADFGAFVELFEGLEGLVHVSELSHERVEKPEDRFAVGQEVRVKVIKLDPIEKKVGLSIKAALDEPDSDTVKQYFDNQPGDGSSATLGGGVMSDALLRAGATPVESEAAPEPVEETVEAEAATPVEATEAPAEAVETPAESTETPAESTSDEDDTEKPENPS